MKTSILSGKEKASLAYKIKHIVFIGLFLHVVLKYKKNCSKMTVKFIKVKLFSVAAE